MKKIGIVTLNDNYNYGNRLQNYAVQEFLLEHFQDIDVETIRNFPITNKKCGRLENIIRIIRRNGFEFKRYLKSDKKRLKNFRVFNKNIKYSKKIFSWMHTDWFNKFDYFLVGSDQVWNPNYRMSDLELLKFSKKNKNIAFSASLAVDEIPENKIQRAKDGFNNFEYISVRENRGKEIIESLTGRNDIEVILDPTMLIDSKKWSNLSKKSKIIAENQKYILNYFLGEIPKEWNNEISRIAKENNCKIINILDKNDAYYQCGPEEFLYLEKNAFLVCTDSFHSSVFSIIFNTPFIVFNRKQKKIKSMNSRIDTLLNKFELENRRFEGKIEDYILDRNFSNVEKILSVERERAKQFLHKALKY